MINLSNFNDIFFLHAILCIKSFLQIIKNFFIILFMKYIYNKITKQYLNSIFNKMECIIIQHGNEADCLIVKTEPNLIFGIGNIYCNILENTIKNNKLYEFLEPYFNSLTENYTKDVLTKYFLDNYSKTYYEKKQLKMVGEHLMLKIKK